MADENSKTNAAISKWVESKKKAMDQLDASDKNYYFLKLPSDYFNWPSIRLIQASGVDIAFTCYLKMLVLSIPTKGYLRFSLKVPYNAKLLSSILFNTFDHEEVIDQLLNDWITYGLVDRGEDATLYMTELPQLLTSQSYQAREQEKRRKNKKDKMFEDEEHVEYNPNLDDKDDE